MRLPRIGEVVVALRDGGHDKDGFPRERPLAGRTYRITSIYEMPYGYGCTLAGLDPFPYAGYFLWRKGKKKLSGWYFKPIEAASDEFLSMMSKINNRVLMGHTDKSTFNVTLEGAPDDDPES